jgi:DNA-binding winged helix-turn-helix (wHTH) protein
MLKLRDLATRSDFTVGPLSVSPSRRRVWGPSGEISLEPLVMQVFLLLLDADGRVVTRDEIFDQCWGGTIVGDDSLNRAIAKVRRIAEVSPGLFEIETVPRTGYRLTGEIVALLQTAGEAAAEEPGRSRISRRALVGGGVATLAAAGGGGLWWSTRSRADPRFDALIASAEKGAGNLFESDNDRNLRNLREAVAIRPQSAKAWGLLAVVQSVAAQASEAVKAGVSTSAAEDAARRALAIDPNEPNALLAMYELQGATLDQFARDRALRRIIGIDARNIFAMSELSGLLQSAGLNRESWSWNERALAIDPLSSNLLVRRALKLWIAGRTVDADKVIDQTRALYPSRAEVWSIRFLILALTGRGRAAQAMLEDDPNIFPSPLAALWRACLPALIQASPRAVSVARRACLDGARRAGELAANGVMILAALGEVDAAFDVSSGFLLWRGTIVRGGRSAKTVWNDAAWRMGTQWLFTPPCAVMRSDSRFIPLCADLGIIDYWRSRGVKPDYQVVS